MAEPTRWRAELNTLATAFNAWEEQRTAARRVTEDLDLGLPVDVVAAFRALRATTDELEAAAGTVHALATTWKTVLGDAPEAMVDHTGRIARLATSLGDAAREWVSCVTSTSADIARARELMAAMTVDGATLSVAGMWLQHEEAGTLNRSLADDHPRPRATTPPCRIADRRELTPNRLGITARRERQVLEELVAATTWILVDSRAIGLLRPALEPVGWTIKAGKEGGGKGYLLEQLPAASPAT